MYSYVKEINHIRHVIQGQPKSQNSLIQQDIGLSHYDQETVVENETAD
jgi:hypothetical protein